jgi:hypothetical protein
MPQCGVDLSWIHGGIMKTEKEIRSKIAEIDSDERFHYPVANVVINAPLALIQTDLEAVVAALAWVLGENPPKAGPRKKS